MQQDTQGGYWVNLDDLLDNLATAARDNNMQQAAAARDAIIRVVENLQRGIEWHQEENRLYTQFFFELRTDGEKEWLCLPSAKPFHNHIFKVEYHGELRRLADDDGSPIPSSGEVRNNAQ